MNVNHLINENDLLQTRKNSATFIYTFIYDKIGKRQTNLNGNIIKINANQKYNVHNNKIIKNI